MTLVEFYLARLAQVEQWALAAQDGDGYAEWDNPSTGVVQVAGGDLDGLVTAPRNAAVHIALHDPARVLREVESKRRIVERYVEAERAAGEISQLDLPEPRGSIERAGYQQACAALRSDVQDLVSVFADHPEYNESWRPQGQRGAS